MGKHDKQTTFSWQPMPNEWYEARIKTLENENRKLSERVKDLEKTLHYMERRVETTERWGTEEVVSLEKMLLNAAKQVWGEE